MTTALDPQESTDLGLEDIPCHYICIICYPESYFGMPALCGAPLLGIPADGATRVCETCTDIEFCPTCGFPFKAWFNAFGDED